MHIASGLLAATFPWLFDSSLPVIAVCTASLIAMLGIRYVGSLNRYCGSVLGGVARKSLGEVYFPIAVALTYVLADGNVAFYLAPILVMTFSDTAAAFVGLRYGRHRFPTRDGNKSLEGCSAFYLTSVPCTVLPLKMWTSLPLWEIVALTIFLVGLLTVVEARSWAGIDNLAVPVVGAGFLQVTAMLPGNLILVILVMAMVAGLIDTSFAIATRCAERRESRRLAFGTNWLL